MGSRPSLLTGRSATLPREFVEGRRTNGSPNCSHGWARTVDGLGGTWPQVHLLGTAALERCTGYTGQSRSRHATHTWNVTRLPDIDHGGVLADQRTPEREVLDALRRQPDTAFAIHDAPSRFQRLLAERAELRALLQDRPPDRRPTLHQAELALESAKMELYWARYRLDHAQDRASTSSGPSPSSATTAGKRRRPLWTRSTGSPTTSAEPKPRSPGANEP